MKHAPLAIALALALLPAHAQAQSSARMTSAALAPVLSQNIVVDNRPGATGSPSWCAPTRCCGAGW